MFEDEDKKQKLQNLQHQKENSFEDDSEDDKPFNFPKPKDFDLKSLWLKDTDAVLKKFDEKLSKVKEEQKNIKEEFKKFVENENRYRISSMKKIATAFDHRKLYQEYLKRSRKLIEKLNPALILNIISYCNSNVFLELIKWRRVSKIYEEIYKNQQIQLFMAEKDYLYEGQENPIQLSVLMCKKFAKFHKTFLYYKAIQYTQQIPQNSIQIDLHEAVNFINEIHRIVYTRRSKNFTYYISMNKFMKKNRVIIGLSSLSLTSLVLVRKSAIIAFSNYLSLNPNERSKQEITKTKYYKVIQVVDKEDYRDTLILNTKVANFLWENYALSFSVFIATYDNAKNHMPVKTWNILIFHLHNQLKTTYLQNVTLKENKFESARLDLTFSEDMSQCTFATIEMISWLKIEMHGTNMISLIGLEADRFSEESLQSNLGICHFFSGEQYYIIVMPASFDF